MSEFFGSGPSTGLNGTSTKTRLQEVRSRISDTWKGIRSLESALFSFLANPEIFQVGPVIKDEDGKKTHQTKATPTTIDTTAIMSKISNLWNNKTTFFKTEGHLVEAIDIEEHKSEEYYMQQKLQYYKTANGIID